MSEKLANYFEGPIFVVRRLEARNFSSMTPAELAGCGLEPDVVDYIITLRNSAEGWRRLYNYHVELPVDPFT